MGMDFSKHSKVLESVEYGHFILNDTYNSVISDQPVQHSLSKIEGLYTELCSPDSVLWRRTDNVPKDLARVCPVVLKYIQEQKLAKPA